MKLGDIITPVALSLGVGGCVHPPLKPTPDEISEARTNALEQIQCSAEGIWPQKRVAVTCSVFPKPEVIDVYQIETNALARACMAIFNSYECLGSSRIGDGVEVGDLTVVCVLTKVREYKAQ